MFKKNKNHTRSPEEYLLESKNRLFEYDKYVTSEESMKDKTNKSDSKLVNFNVIQPKVTLNDVVLSRNTALQIEEGIAKLKFHKTIYEEWGFSSVDKQGKTVILNFFGPPGTGKTLTAEAFAGTLNMPIIMLGIAELESKFMGETSKKYPVGISSCIRTKCNLIF
ncbi:AAA family ATPase [Pasteurella multocida]|uniref:AAA family ATPase n=1 Tax=Pasteurella multocida TaxID=747 RepID=UPI000F70BE35|nr:ATP-binding protein [Pasteurella multocida]VEJ15617.1 ATPase [Pasteurella multocida subsp. septica]HEA3247289.1 ATP-binding protein [Pasteurella multocida]